MTGGRDLLTGEWPSEWDSGEIEKIPPSGREKFFDFEGEERVV
jgi:hypothetical protein